MGLIEADDGVLDRPVAPISVSARAAAVEVVLARRIWRIADWNIANSARIPTAITLMAMSSSTMPKPSSVRARAYDRRISLAIASSLRVGTRLTCTEWGMYSHRVRPRTRDMRRPGACRSKATVAAFAYTAVNATGAEVAGEVHAGDLASAREQLRSRGLLPTQLAEQDAGSEPASSDVKRVKPKSLGRALALRGHVTAPTDLQPALRLDGRGR